MRHQIMVTVNSMAHDGSICAMTVLCTVGEGIAYCDEYAAQHLRVLHSVTPIDLLVQSAIQYALPKVPFRTTPTAMRHQIMVTINSMAHDGSICAMTVLCTVGEGIAYCDEYAAQHLRVLHSVTPIDLLVQSAIQYALPKVPFRTTPTAMRHQIMVTINKMNEWIVRADATRLGGHVSPPLPM